MELKTYMVKFMHEGEPSSIVMSFKDDAELREYFKERLISFRRLSALEYS